MAKPNRKKPAPKPKSRSKRTPAKKAAGYKSRAKAKASIKAPTKGALPAAGSFLEALNTSPIGAAISRFSDGIILLANTGTERFFGLSKGRAAGLSTADLFVDPKNREDLVELVRERAGVTRHRLEIEFRDMSVTRMVEDVTFIDPNIPRMMKGDAVRVRHAAAARIRE